jgi:hypothetical protein
VSPSTVAPRFYRATALRCHGSTVGCVSVASLETAVPRVSGGKVAPNEARKRVTLSVLAGENASGPASYASVAIDLGCVKTCACEEGAELFSLLSSSTTSRQCC